MREIFDNKGVDNGRDNGQLVAAVIVGRVIGGARIRRAEKPKSCRDDAKNPTKLGNPENGELESNGLSEIARPLQHSGFELSSRRQMPENRCGLTVDLVTLSVGNKADSAFSSRYRMCGLELLGRPDSARTITPAITAIARIALSDSAEVIHSYRKLAFDPRRSEAPR